MVSGEISCALVRSRVISCDLVRSRAISCDLVCFSLISTLAALRSIACKEKSGLAKIELAVVLSLRGRATQRLPLWPDLDKSRRTSRRTSRRASASLGGSRQISATLERRIGWPPDSLSSGSGPVRAEMGA